MIDILIEPNKIKDVFNALEWNVGTDEGFIIFKSPDNSIYTPLPIQKEQEAYRYYMEKALKMILYIINVNENTENLSELADQIINPNYKFYNRIELKSDYINRTVPFELANNFPLKNVEAFRTFYAKKTKGQGAIPIENFELNHTQKGSFVIPISVKAELDAMQFPDIPNKTHLFVKEYLDLVDTLVNIPLNEDDNKTYANQVVESGIDSRIVKDILGTGNSIASYKEKYIESVKDLTVTSRPNILLDRKLSEEQNRFKQIDLTKCRLLRSDVIKTIEDIEIKKDDSNLYFTGAEIEALVDSVDENGTAKFTILKINKSEVDNPFKSITTKLPKSILNFCADAFKSRDPIWIKGDIEKAKGKMGSILHEKFGNINAKNNQISLFEAETNTEESTDE